MKKFVKWLEDGETGSVRRELFLSHNGLSNLWSQYQKEMAVWTIYCFGASSLLTLGVLALVG